jgi:hypothetical protein
MSTGECDAGDSERDPQRHDTADHRRSSRVHPRHQELPIARGSAVLILLSHVSQSEQQSMGPASERRTRRAISPRTVEYHLHRSSRSSGSTRVNSSQRGSSERGKRGGGGLRLRADPTAHLEGGGKTRALVRRMRRRAVTAVAFVPRRPHVVEMFACPLPDGEERSGQRTT